MSDSETATPETAQSQPPNRRRIDPLLLGVLALATAGLLLLGIFGYMLFFNDGSDGESDIIQATSTPGGTPEPTREIPEDEEIIIVFDGANTLSINLDPPQLLEIGTSNVPVRTRLIGPADQWQAEAGGSTAEWMYGTIVNYVFGLPNTDANRQLMERLVQGDRLAITTRGGQEIQFAVTGREVTTVSPEQIYAQNRPAITLVWLGELSANPDERLIVQADFVLPAEQASEPASAIVQPGETAQLAELRLTVNNTTQIVDDPNTPPGFSVFIVDYEIQNLGGIDLDTGLIRFALVDQQGNQYSLNSQASQSGSYPLLTGLLPAGGQQQVSAGYQIPNGLAGDTLRWVVSRVDNPSQVEVQIPFSGRSVDQATTELQTAQISSDGTALILAGQITNLGSQPLVITESDVTLGGEGTIYLVFSTNPGFPWTIGPGQTMPFALNFQRPGTPDAVFKIGAQSFELNNLR